MSHFNNNIEQASVGNNSNELNEKKENVKNEDNIKKTVPVDKFDKLNNPQENEDNLKKDINNNHNGLNGYDILIEHLREREYNSFDFFAREERKIKNHQRKILFSFTLFYIVLVLSIPCSFFYFLLFLSNTDPEISLIQLIKEVPNIIYIIITLLVGPTLILYLLILKVFQNNKTEKADNDEKQQAEIINPLKNIIDLLNKLIEKFSNS